MPYRSRRLFRPVRCRLDCLRNVFDVVGCKNPQGSPPRRRPDALGGQRHAGHDAARSRQRDRYQPSHAQLPLRVPGAAAHGGRPRGERQQRAAFVSTVGDPASSPIDVLRNLWTRAADSARHPQARLFFEIYARALRDPTGARGFLQDVIDAWLRRLPHCLRASTSGPSGRPRRRGSRWRFRAAFFSTCLRLATGRRQMP